MAIKPYNRQLLIFLVIPLVIGLSYVTYRAIQSARISSYFSQVDRIQKDANTKMAELNTTIAYFQLNPSVAAQVLPKFQEAQTVMSDAASSLEGIDPPGDEQTYHRNLISLYQESSALSGDFAANASYVQERNRLIQDLSASLDQFNNTVSGAATNDAEVVAAAGRLRTTSDATITGLQQLQPPLKIYSSAQLQHNLSALSQTMSLLETAIAAADSGNIKLAAQQLQELFARDWSGTLVQLDSDGAKSYQGRLDELKSLQEEIVAERSRLG